MDENAMDRIGAVLVLVCAVLVVLVAGRLIFQAVTGH